MGYLSCKSQASISTVHHPNKPEKPIKIQEFKYTDLELATNNFSDSKLLGKGSHGLVYKGVLRSGRQVAIKKPSRTPPSENPNEVENEIDILSKLQSPRLVNLVGYSRTDSRNRLLVVEFMSNGTLYDVLHSNSAPPNWGRRIKLALQTAKAIDTLHSLNPPVIHRDIKSANVLIDRNFNARLGDFGLALRCVDDCRLRSTPPAGTMGYLDPCYVTPDNLSTKTDVFSFGILLLEIVSGRKAIDMAHSPPSVVDWAIPLIKRGKLLGIYDPRILPPKDGVVRKMLAVMAAKCVRSCRERRPSMKEVVGCLSQLSRLVPVHSWNGLANPCLMVESVGRPVQLRSDRVNSNGVEKENGNLDVVVVDDDDDKFERPLRNPRRVYSDLGLRSSLMDLLTSPDGRKSSSCGVDDDSEPKVQSAKRALSFRFESRRFGGKTRIRSLVLGDWKERAFNLKPNQSVGKSSDKISEPDDGVKGSPSVTQDAELQVTL